MWKYFLYKIKKTLPSERVPRIRPILAALYAFSAWNLAILTFYYSIEDNLPVTAEGSTYYKFNNLNYIFNVHCCTHILHSINFKSLQKKDS